MTRVSPDDRAPGQIEAGLDQAGRGELACIDWPEHAVGVAESLFNEGDVMDAKARQGGNDGDPSGGFQGAVMRQRWRGASRQLGNMTRLKAETGAGGNEPIQPSS